MDIESFNAVQKALAEPKRLEILEAIRRVGNDSGVACSCVLSEMSVSQSTFSHHVSELAKAGLVQERKEGRFSMLSVDEHRVDEYLKALREKILG